MKRARRTLGSSGLKGHAEPSQRKKSRKKTNELKKNMKILIPQRGEGQDTGRRFVLLHRDVSHHENENRKVKNFIFSSVFLFPVFGCDTEGCVGSWAWEQENDNFKRKNKIQLQYNYDAFMPDNISKYLFPPDKTRWLSLIINPLKLHINSSVSQIGDTLLRKPRHNF